MLLQYGSTTQEKHRRLVVLKNDRMEVRIDRKNGRTGWPFSASVHSTTVCLCLLLFRHIYNEVTQITGNGVGASDN